MQEQSVSEELQRLRISAGMSQKALADLLGVNVASVCRWETGSRIPKRDKLEKLAVLFHCSIAGVSIPSDPSDTLGNQLRELRIKSKLTLEQVAELLEISVGTIFHWENDDYAPKPDNLKKLADLYQETIAEIRPPINQELSSGKKIREIRIRANISQVLAAELLDCAQKDISRWENDVVAPNRISLEKIVALYHCDINDLM